MKAYEAIAQRITNGENAFVSLIMEQYGATKEKAEALLALYKHHRLIKIDPVMGTFRAKLGIAMDPKTVRGALASLEQ